MIIATPQGRWFAKTKKARLPASDLGCGNGTSPEQDFDPVSQGIISQDDHGESEVLIWSEKVGEILTQRKNTRWLPIFSLLCAARQNSAPWLPWMKCG